MRKTEFIDLLKYYFRHSDKSDLKGILEDCEEQFRIGAKKGQTEEEICAKLGHPKNIYRYYIGKPIVPEDNLSLAAPPPMPADRMAEAHAPEDKPAQFYDWEKDSPRRRSSARESAYTAPQPNRYYRTQQQPRQAPQPQQDETLQWQSDTSIPQTAKVIASPFLDIVGTLFSIVSSLLFFVFALALLAAIAIYSLPPYFYSDLLPLPTISLSTLIFTVLAILFAALTATYASQACHQTAYNARNPQRRNR